MFLRPKTRTKDGKTHRYWNVVENRRAHGGRVVQRDLLYLGEINDAQHAGWVRTIDALDGNSSQRRQLALFPEDYDAIPPLPWCEVVQVRLDKIELHRLRQWGACWLALHLWDVLEPDRFWAPLLPAGHKGTRWLNVLKALTAFRLIDPDSEYRFHCEWFLKSALADLLGEDFAIAQKDTLYRCLDKLAAHKEDLFDFLKERWGALFGASYDVLLYDLTSTYFEGLGQDNPQAKRGYTRDGRPDCVQVCIALVVTPEGLPLAYEVYPGNTRDTATLAAFLDQIEARYGKARRTWPMDRGIPTEETLKAMRGRGIQYLVGTPKGRLTKLEAALLERPWSQARESVAVKTLLQEGEFYVYVESRDRVAMERVLADGGAFEEVFPKAKGRKAHSPLRVKEVLFAERRYVVCFNEDQATKDRHDREAIMAALEGALKQGKKSLIGNKGFRRYVAASGERFSIDIEKVKAEARYDGLWVLATNTDLSAREVALKYKQLWMVEDAFRSMKSLLSTRPIWHQCDETIVGHVFCSFLALLLRKRLQDRLDQKGWTLEWAAVIRDVEELVETEISVQGKGYVIRSQAHGVAGKVAQACGVALPPTLQSCAPPPEAS